MTALLIAVGTFPLVLAFAIVNLRCSTGAWQWPSPIHYPSIFINWLLISFCLWIGHNLHIAARCSS